MTSSPIRTKKEALRKVAIVTGASSGFGMLTSVKLAEEGYQVIATMRNMASQDELQRLVTSKQVQQQVEVCYMDITDHLSIEQTITRTIEQYGHIDLLVNNAGYAQGGFVEEVRMDQFREQLDTNVLGTIAMTKAVLPYMREKQSGTIINISSVSGRIALPGYAPYATSKFAVEGFSEALRLEMKPYGVHIVLVEPGSYPTNIWEKGFRSIARKENSPYQSYLDRILRFSQKSASGSNDPGMVANLIAAIAEKKRPHLRYVIGKGSRTIIAIRSLFPWTWVEWIMLFMLRK